MTEPTVASAVLQDDGRFLITLNDGSTFYTALSSGEEIATLRQILATLGTISGLTGTGSLGAHGGIEVEGVASGTVVPVSAASLPLPSGAATAARQDATNAVLGTVDDGTDGSGGDPTIAASVTARLTALLRGPLQLQAVAAASTPLPLQAGTNATRTSDAIVVTGTGLTLVVTLADKAGTATITPTVQGQTASGAWYDLWTAAAALSANGTVVYQLGRQTSTAGGVTESKIAVLPATVRVLLTYTGAGGANTFATTADVDVSP